MKKTIKELADELGVSKDKVKYQVRKLPSNLTTKDNGITYVEEQGITLIKNIIVGKKSEPKTSELTTSYLTSQIDTIKEELYQKNKQIIQLQKLLENQQILTKQTLDENEKIKLEIKELTYSEQKSKKKWFKFWT